MISTPDFDNLQLHVDPRGVATLTLAREEKHNALNAQMIQELRRACAWLAETDTVRVVVLSALGKSFCAGGDLSWMQSQAEKDRAGKIAESSELAFMLRDLDSLPKPLIARVQGQAFGGGIGMMAVCDSVISVDTARFALTETRLGLIPATIGPYVVRRLGEGAARQVFMSGQVFNAERAVTLGLVAKTCRVDELDATVEAEVLPYLDCAPGAVAAAKALCQHLARNPDEDQLDYTAACLADRWESPEAQHGIDCFFQRKTPEWKQA